MFYMKHIASNRKTTIKGKPIIKKTNSNKIVQVVKPKSKKAEAVAFVKTPKSKIATANKPKVEKLTSTDRNVKSVGKKFKLNKVSQTIKPKTKVKAITIVPTPKSKTRKLKPIISAKQINHVVGKKISPVSDARKVEKLNSVKIRLNAPEKSIKAKKIKSPTKIVPVKKAKTVEKKGKQNTVAQKAKTQTKNNKSAKTIQVVKTKTRGINPVNSAVKIEDKKTKNKSANSKNIVPVKKIKSESKQIKPNDFTQTIKPKKAEIIKAKTKKAEPIVPVRQTKAIKTKTVILPVEKKLKRKKIKPISSAVFRGRKDRYDFKVFPLDTDFEDVSAIYVISRRKIDRQKKGHHALVCIGQTDSVLGEIKRHKIKCIKKHNANVISILPEADVKKRLKIEEDLRAAHAVACNIG